MTCGVDYLHIAAPHGEARGPSYQGAGHAAHLCVGVHEIVLEVACCEVGQDESRVHLLGIVRDAVALRVEDVRGRARGPGVPLGQPPALTISRTSSGRESRLGGCRANEPVQVARRAQARRVLSRDFERETPLPSGLPSPADKG